MEEQKCQIHRFLLAATQAGRRGKNYTMNWGSISDLKWPQTFYYCRYLTEIRECTEQETYGTPWVLSKGSGSQQKSCSPSVFTWSSIDMSIFSKSLLEWVQLQPLLHGKEQLHQLPLAAGWRGWTRTGSRLSGSGAGSVLPSHASLWRQVRQGIWGNTKVVPRASRALS